MRSVDVDKVRPEGREGGALRILILSLLLLLAARTGIAQASTNAETEPSGNVERRPLVHLTLQDAVTRAMRHNRHVELASLDVTQAEAKRKIAQSSYYPHIKNESTALYVTALQGVVVPAGALSQSGVAGLVPSQTLVIGQGSQKTYTSGTGLVQPITQLFKVHAGVQAANAEVEITKIDAADAANSVSLLTHKLYFEILTKQEELKAADAAIQSSVVANEESTNDIAEGKSLEIAGLETRASLLETRRQSLIARLAIDDLVLQLDDVVGLPLGTRLELDSASVGEGPIIPSEADAIAQIEAKNPKVLAAIQDVEKAKAALSAAKTAYIPDVTGVARYSYQSGIPFLVHNFGTFGGTISYDLFDGGTREGHLKAAKIQLQMAELQFAQTKADVSIQVSAVYDDIRKMQQLMSVVTANVAVREEQSRVAQRRFREDAGLASEVGRSRANLATARTSLLGTQLGLILLKDQVLTLLAECAN
ncbi:TolC family protein [Terriglobus sp. ADX1]|uniref:TolC family protein n=1 Tax=Terriglobus sp. ADX1 TaxID=2794063 RepID=UPI002FE664A7